MITMKPTVESVTRDTLDVSERFRWTYVEPDSLLDFETLSSSSRHLILFSHPIRATHGFAEIRGDRHARRNCVPR